MPSPDAQGPEGTPAVYEDPDGSPGSEGDQADALRWAFQGTDTGAFVGMSEAIRNLGLNLARSIQVPLPDFSQFVINSPAFAALRKPLIDPNFLKLATGLAPIQAQISAGVAQLAQAQHDQIAKIIQASSAIFKNLYPPNWEGVKGVGLELVLRIALDEGIPLVAVPRPATVQLIVKAPDLRTRRAIIGRRWRSITSDCEACLRELKASETSSFVHFVGKVISALRDGHSEAAQALAANLLDSLLLTHFSQDLKAIKKAHYKRASLDLDDYTVRLALAIAPAWRAYQTFHPGNGDRVPRDFARHASAHAVSERQYSRVNAVIALMLVTSLLWVFEH
jgi:hypothetical protein